MPKKILIVDDDMGVCDSLAKLLRGEGYSVDNVTDSKTAVILIKKEKYDICLFDYKMPGFNGIELLKMTKNINPMCSVIIISGMLNIDDLCSEEISSGLLTGIVQKPFDVELLLKKIELL